MSTAASASVSKDHDDRNDSRIDDKSLDKSPSALRGGVTHDNDTDDSSFTMNMTNDGSDADGNGNACPDRPHSHSQDIILSWRNLVCAPRLNPSKLLLANLNGHIMGGNFVAIMG
jgi:hypothetical protein